MHARLPLRAFAGLLSILVAAAPVALALTHNPIISDKKRVYENIAGVDLEIVVGANLQTISVPDVPAGIDVTIAELANAHIIPVAVRYNSQNQPEPVTVSFTLRASEAGSDNPQPEPSPYEHIYWVVVELTNQTVLPGTLSTVAQGNFVDLAVGTYTIPDFSPTKTYSLVVVGDGRNPFDNEDTSLDGQLSKTEVLFHAVLLPVEIKQVYETDQRLNEAPNPRRPDYANNEADSETIFKRLYCAIEPETGKVEVAVQLVGAGSADGKLMCCLEYNGILTTPPIAFDSSGKAELSINPLGNLMSDSIHKVRVGYDANSNGSLEASELAPVEPKPFTVGSATAADQGAALPILRLASGIDNIAGHHVAVFISRASSLPEAVAGSVSQSITNKNPTLIAGSPYSGAQGGGGTTVIPKFAVPSPSNDSQFIADEFATEVNLGLHGLVNEAWSENITKIGSEVGASNGSQAWITLTLTGKSVNFYYSGSHPLRLALGQASCAVGTARILCERTAAGIKAKTIELTCTIEDLYDFDVTRPSSSLSRKGSIVQLGWESTNRPEGRIFFTAYAISAVFNSSTVVQGKNVIDFFNQYSSSYVASTNSE